MAGSLTLALRTAQSGLLVNQAALDTVANNIANVNSPDYSRKVAHMEQRVVGGAGAGVQLSDVQRRVDEGLLKSMRLELTSYNEYSVQSSYYDRMQDTFGSPQDNSSIAHTITSFSESLETLAFSPDQLLEQSEVVRQGDEVTNKLQFMTETIQELRLQADKEIAETVDSINQITSNIVDLNNKIIRNSAISADVTDLRDKRDTALNSLASFIDISYFARSDGDIVVFTKGGRTLVDNATTTTTHTAASATSPTATHANGDFAPIYLGDKIAANDITNEVRSGKLKGLIDLRDSVLPNLQSQIDNMASEVRDQVNLVHNRGAGYPGLQSADGTRIFTSSSTQTITMGSSSDVRIALMDTTGAEVVNTTLETIMQSNQYGALAAGTAANAEAANGPWTIDEVAANVQSWLRAQGLSGATMSVGTDGRMDMSLNDTTRALVFRDEVNSAGTVPAPEGSTAADATIQFNADAANGIDETVSGFSNFFGLNDFFVDGQLDNIHESNVMTTSYVATKAATLTFNDATGALGTVAVTAGESLATIAANINTADIGVTATIIPDGAGQRLRIMHTAGNNVTVTNDVTAGDTFLSDVSFHVSDARTASTLNVRSDIQQGPGKISGGQLRWDSAIDSNGGYFMSVADNTNAKALAALFTTNTNFAEAGGISNTSNTFGGHAAGILSRNASLAAGNNDQKEYKQALTESLRNKSDTFRGVNLDEEMSQLMLFEQGYSAAAKVIATIQSMFDALDQIV